MKRETSYLLGQVKKMEAAECLPSLSCFAVCLLLQEFVEASHQTKWCPHAGCGKVVSYTRKGSGAWSEVNVECEDGHTFCW